MPQNLSTSRETPRVRKRLKVSGLVQGVGFRPFVFRLANEQGVAGTVANNEAGVVIEIEGPSNVISDFAERLEREKPPLACITAMQSEEIPCQGEDGFHILASKKSQTARTLISADVATCDDCLRELFDPNDRRYLYPFINCTNCGPRFTIIRSLPYDRPSTSMSIFSMCPDCQAEYDDPADRRFHAQPNACWECGPRVRTCSAEGDDLGFDNPIQAAAELLCAGKILAIKGLGGFHLTADATRPEAVEELRRRKQRIDKPFAVMVPDVETAQDFIRLGSAEREALLSPQRPIVLAEKRLPFALAEAIAPGNRNVGIFLPYSPLHHVLFRLGGFRALVMTSANLSEEPIVIANDEALQRLRGIADAFVFHNRDILLRCDDSVVQCVSGKIRQIRRSRGFVPFPVFLDKEIPPILAVGGHQKETICLTKGKNAFLSQHIGDMENLESHRFFEEAVSHLKQVLELEPVAIAHDMHPRYMTTQWALQQPLPHIAVQHHHAHIASCMAEHQLDRKVIGIALDGSGYGTDGAVWGGEILTCDFKRFERSAHLEYVRMPGGEAAIREPWRMAASYLLQHLGMEIPEAQGLVKGVSRRELEIVARMLKHGVNAPWTSSCGRLFDAVAALIGIRSKINYEAQAAIELEACRNGQIAVPPYPFEVRQQGRGFVIGVRPLFEAIVADLRAGEHAGMISQRFHDGLAAAVVDVAVRLSHKSGIDTICLSGGTFQNRYLLEQCERKLREGGVNVFSQSNVPTGDGGLSLGQAMIAARQFQAMRSM